MTISLNDFHAKRGVITIPRQGAMYATLLLDNPDNPRSPQFAAGQTLLLKVDAIQYSVTVISASPASFGDTSYNVVGGKGHMFDDATPRNVVGSTRSVVIKTIMADAPAEVIGTSDLPFGQVKNWQTIQGASVGAQLQNFVAEFGAVWRTRRTGQIDVKLDTYAAATLPVQNQRVNADDHSVSYAVQLFDVVPEPGTTVDGIRVEEVEIEFNDLSSQLTLRSATLASALATALGGSLARTMFSQTWPATITRQTGQKVAIKPDDARIKGKGLDNVPFNYGLPLITATNCEGCRVRFGYDAGNPGRPRIVAFEASTGSGTCLITIGDVGNAQYVALSNIVNQNFEDLKTAYDAHFHPTPNGPSSPPTQPAPTPADTACTRLKSE